MHHALPPTKREIPPLLQQQWSTHRHWCGTVQLLQCACVAAGDTGGFCSSATPLLHAGKLITHPRPRSATVLVNLLLLTCNRSPDVHSPPSPRGRCGLEHSTLLQLPAELLHGDRVRVQGATCKDAAGGGLRVCLGAERGRVEQEEDGDVARKLPSTFHCYRF
jgi:hypothetical protein